MAEFSSGHRIQGLFSKITSKYHGYCTAYKEWVTQNPEVASQIEHTFRIMSYFVSGRFEQSQELAELVYAASNLMVYVNDAILRKATKLRLKLPPPSQYRMMSWLTIIEYIEVFVEIAARRLWGEAGRWVVIVIIQIVKAALRAILLMYHKVGLQSMPPLFPLNRQTCAQMADDVTAVTDDVTAVTDDVTAVTDDVTESGEETRDSETGAVKDFSGDFERVYRECESATPKRNTFTGKRTGRVVRTLHAAPPLNCRTWKLPTTNGEKKEEPWSKYLPPTRLTKQMLIAESLHIARPLAHLASMFKFGQTSWKPWLLACGMDISSLLMMRDGGELNVNEKAEIKRRTAYLLYYLLRSPFYDRYSKAKIILVLSAMANKVPGAGLVVRPLLDYLPYWQQVYFYNWGY